MGRRSWLLGGLVLAAQLAVGWMLLVFGGVGVLSESLSRPNESAIDPYHPPLVLTDGRLVTRAGSSYRVMNYEDAQGRPVEGKVEEARSLRLYGSPFSDKRQPWVLALGGGERRSLDGSQGPLSELWYQVWPQGSLAGWYLVGYSAATRRPIAWVSRRGVVSAEPPRADWFPDPRDGKLAAMPAAVAGWFPDPRDGKQAADRMGAGAGFPLLLPAGDEVWGFRPDERAVEVLFAAPGVLSIESPYNRAGTERAPTVARSADRLYVLTKDGAPPRQLVLPPALRRSGSAGYDSPVQIWLPDDGTGVAAYGPQHSYYATRLLRFAADGTVLSDEPLPPRMVLAARDDPSDRWTVPPAVAAAPWIGVAMLIWPSGNSAADVALVRHVGLPLATVVSALLMLLVVRRQRRRGGRYTWVWLIFVALGGPFFWLGYRGHRRWDGVA
jgi:hypothetical protein